MSEEKILTMEEQEVLLEAAKSVLRLVLNKFEVPGHVSLRFTGANPKNVAEGHEVTGFKLKTLSGQDIEANKEALQNAIAPSASYGFACWVETTPGDGWLGGPSLTGSVTVSK